MQPSALILSVLYFNFELLETTEKVVKKQPDTAARKKCSGV